MSKASKVAKRRRTPEKRIQDRALRTYNEVTRGVREDRALPLWRRMAWWSR